MSRWFAPAPRALVVGCNHRSSPLAIRDRLYVEESAVAGILDRLRAAGIGQAMMVSTCDRVEVVAIDSEPEAAARRINDVLAGHARLAPTELFGHLYTLCGEDAVRHVFSVAASLDSLIVGEPHVLGQIKAAHRMARELAMSGAELESILQAAYATAKRVRAETAIGERPVSIASVACELARGLHGDLAHCTAIFVGTGEMGALIVETLRASGLGSLRVTDPKPLRAEAVARTFGCHVVGFDDLAGDLAAADIIVAALGSRQVVVTGGMLKAALKARRKRPVFVIDAAVPGDVDPVVDRLDDVFRYTLDDLERVALEGRALRAGEAAAAWRIVDEALAAFDRDAAERQAVPLLTVLHQHFETAREEALADAGGDADKATRLLVHRLLHAPSEVLRAAAAGGRGDHTLKTLETALTRLFRLRRPDQENDG
jgi:glutamyl-tRNA reductase